MGGDWRISWRGKRRKKGGGNVGVANNDEIWMMERNAVDQVQFCTTTRKKSTKPKGKKKYINYMVENIVVCESKALFIL